MIFMRWCVGVLTWIAILFFIAATAVLGWQYYKKGVATKQYILQKLDLITLFLDY